jgi:hypothetical protein
VIGLPSSGATDQCIAQLHVREAHSMSSTSPILKVILIVLAVIGLIAVLGIAGMAVMHVDMMHRI